MDEDASRLKTTALSLLSDMGSSDFVLPDELCNEMCRFGAAELHVVAAFVGGIASQEIIKVRFMFLFIFISQIGHRGISLCWIFLQLDVYLLSFPNVCSLLRSSLFPCWELSSSTALITSLSL